MDVSQITDDLFIGTTPDLEDFDTLRALGIALVINMRAERPPRRDPHNPGIATLWLPTFDTPLLPIPMRSLQRGVEAALSAMQTGQKVYVHCAAGVHRSAALAATILIGLGWPIEAAIEKIKTGRPIADPEVWYIYRRIQRFAQIWGNDAGVR